MCRIFKGLSTTGITILQDVGMGTAARCWPPRSMALFLEEGDRKQRRKERMMAIVGDLLVPVHSQLQLSSCGPPTGPSQACGKTPIGVKNRSRGARVIGLFKRRGNRAAKPTSQPLTQPPADPCSHHPPNRSPRRHGPRGKRPRSCGNWGFPRSWAVRFTHPRA